MHIRIIVADGSHETVAISEGWGTALSAVVQISWAKLMTSSSIVARSSVERRIDTSRQNAAWADSNRLGSIGARLIGREKSICLLYTSPSPRD